MLAPPNRREEEMTGKSAFTEEEWKAILEGPPIAGMLVVTAESGGSFRETFALAKAYAEAREEHGESELLDDIVSTKPQFDRHKFGSQEELKQGGLDQLREAVSLLESKATPEEVGDYRSFVLALTQRVAAAHKEHGQSVSPNEQSAIDAVAASLGA
jgi:hypothetical protein